MDQIKFPHIFPINIDVLEAIKTDEGHIWGYEVWLVNDKKLDLGCKLLIIFPGFLSSKHKHATKSEYFQVLSGKLDLHIWEYDDIEDCQTYELEAGKQYFVPANTYHRFETGTKQFVLLLEVSTFEDEQTEKELPSENIY